jgi:integrase
MHYLRHEFYQDLAQSTKDRYEYAFQNFLPVFRDMEVADITKGDIYQYLQYRKQYRDAANCEHGVIKRHFDLACLLDWRIDNPASDIPWNGYVKRERILTSEEFSRIYHQGNQPVQLAMDLGYMLGLRIGDILSMVWDQVDDGGVFVHQSKNEVKGYYEMSSDLNAALGRARKLHGRNVLPTPELHVVHNRKMQQYTYYGFRAMFRRAVMKAKVENVRFHDIRRTAITAADTEGRAPQSFSLHKSARQAANYVVRVPNVVPLKMM